VPLWVSFALIAVGLVAIFIEIFVPAAGLIGLAGGGMIVAAVVLGFVEHDAATGSIVLITALLVTPTAVVIGLRLFPRTPVGRRLILGNPDATSGDAPATGEHGSESAIVPGATGEALTDLRPSGTARIDDRKLSVVTRGEYLDRGQAVRVVRVEGNRVVVAELKS
jgi:membrane-bound serine protease (ClpP class)